MLAVKVDVLEMLVYTTNALRQGRSVAILLTYADVCPTYADVC